MRAYKSYLKREIEVGLQYKQAAIAGLITQVFWGLLYAFVYEAFYKSANIDNISMKQLMCYVWLNQAFLALIFPTYREEKIIKDIKDGTVAYELCRPYDLYFWWFIKLIAKKLSSCALRCAPILVFSFLLPSPYNLTLPVSIEAFILFIIALFLGTIIISSIGMIVQIISFFTHQDKGISSIVSIVGGLLQGMDVPLPLLPAILLSLTNFLPFRLISDLSQRIYSGNISIINGINGIIFQIIWIIILITIGKMMMNKALKKVTIQGG